MIQSTTLDLEKLGRDAAEYVAVADAVEQIEVAAGEDSTDRPVYRFTFLIDDDRLQQGMGLALIRLTQKLGDDLLAVGDEHYAVVRFLDRTDWDKRNGA